MVETTYHPFYGASLLTLVVVDWGEVFSHNNFPKEKEKWKSKYEASIYEWTSLQEELNQCQEEAGHQKIKVKNLYGHKKEVEAHGAPSSLTTRIVNLHGTLYTKDKTLKEFQTSIEEFFQVTFAQNAWKKEKEYRQKLKKEYNNIVNRVYRSLLLLSTGPSNKTNSSALEL